MSDKNTPTSSTQGARSPMELVLEFHRTYSVPIRSFDDLRVGEPPIAGHDELAVADRRGDRIDGAGDGEVRRL